MTTPPNSTAQNPSTPTADPSLQRKIMRTLAKKSFCTLATTSPAGRSHSAGVVYEMVNSTMWIHASSTSRKARSIVQNPHVGVCVPFRRLPVGPPYTIHFQGTAAIVPMDSPVVAELLAAGKLKSISGHGALEMPTGCFITIEPRGSIHSFGPGARVIDIIRDPLGSGARTFSLDAALQNEVNR